MRLDPRALLAPALAFLFGRLVLLAAAWRAFRGEAETWSLDAWARWDSRHYLDIARAGYELFSCARLPGYDPSDWCGNTAWFPGYPLLLRPLLRLGLPELPAAAALSGLFAFLAIHALWTRLLERRTERGPLLALALAAVAPGAVYQNAVFPISMCVFFQIRALDALLRERWTAAGLWAAAASFSYPSGAFLVFVFAAYGLLVRRAFDLPRLAREALLPSALASAGVLLVFVLQWLAVGDFGAFWKVQGKYGYGSRWPHETLADRLAPLHGGDGTLFPALQTLLVAAIMLAVLVALLRSWRRIEPADALVSLHGLVYWLLPLALGGGLSLHRADALLLPLVLLARRLPLPLQLGLLGACSFTALRVGARFFRGVLV
jgi:hypothetical protein